MRKYESENADRVAATNRLEATLCHPPAHFLLVNSVPSASLDILIDVNQPTCVTFAFRGRVFNNPNLFVGNSGACARARIRSSTHDLLAKLFTQKR